MKIVLDACVLYPTVMREMVLGVAEAGAFTPVWSPRILEEWARAANKIGPTGELQARAEIALLRERFAGAEQNFHEALVSRLWLPDSNDIHVFALAVSTSAEAIMTLNAKDFPRGVLAEEGILRCDPDGVLTEIWADQPDQVEAVAAGVLAQAKQLSGQDWTMRALLKKARLPRLAKALGQLGR